MRHFTLDFGIYCSSHHDEAGIFEGFLFYLEIVKKMMQVTIKVSEFYIDCIQYMYLV